MGTRTKIRSSSVPRRARQSRRVLGPSPVKKTLSNNITKNTTTRNSILNYLSPAKKSSTKRTPSMGGLLSMTAPVSAPDRPTKTRRFSSLGSSPAGAGNGSGSPLVGGLRLFGLDGVAPEASTRKRPLALTVALESTDGPESRSKRPRSKSKTADPATSETYSCVADASNSLSANDAKRRKNFSESQSMLTATASVMGSSRSDKDDTLNCTTKTSLERAKTALSTNTSISVTNTKGDPPNTMRLALQRILRGDTSSVIEIKPGDILGRTPGNLKRTTPGRPRLGIGKECDGVSRKQLLVRKFSKTTDMICAFIHCSGANRVDVQSKRLSKGRTATQNEEVAKFGWFGLEPGESTCLFVGDSITFDAYRRRADQTDPYLKQALHSFKLVCLDAETTLGITSAVAERSAKSTLEENSLKCVSSGEKQRRQDIDTDTEKKTTLLHNNTMSTKAESSNQNTAIARNEVKEKAQAGDTKSASSVMRDTDGEGLVSKSQQMNVVVSRPSRSQDLSTRALEVESAAHDLSKQSQGKIDRNTGCLKSVMEDKAARRSLEQCDDVSEPHLITQKSSRPAHSDTEAELTTEPSVLSSDSKVVSPSDDMDDASVDVGESSVKEVGANLSLEMSDAAVAQRTLTRAVELLPSLGNSFWLSLDSAEPRNGAAMLMEMAGAGAVAPNSRISSKIRDLIVNGPKSERHRYYDPNKTELALRYVSFVLKKFPSKQHKNSSLYAFVSWEEFEGCLRYAVEAIPKEAHEGTERMVQRLKHARSSIEFLSMYFSRDFQDAVKGQISAEQLIERPSQILSQHPRGVREALKCTAKLIVRFVLRSKMLVSSSQHGDVKTACANLCERCHQTLGSLLSSISWLYCFLETGIDLSSRECAFLLRDAISSERNTVELSDKDYKTLTISFLLMLKGDACAPLRHTLAEILDLREEISLFGGF